MLGLTITPELEEGSQSRRTFVAHAECTSTLATVQRTQDIILEQARHAVVSEPLTQLDNSHQPRRDGQILGDMAQGALFIVGRFLAVRGDGKIFLVDIHGGLVGHHDLLDGDVILVLELGLSLRSIVVSTTSNSEVFKIKDTDTY